MTDRGVRGTAPGSVRGQAALGCRAHSGWATLVAVADSPEGPRAVQRQRVELCQRTPHQPYHAAVGLALAEARERIADSRAEARRLARRALVTVRRELESGGWTVAGLGVLTASGRPLPALASVLASHPLIHSAEGELFRRALLEAGRSAGIAVTALPERELERRAASQLGRPAEELSAVVSGWGRAIGPPWRREERLAGLLAWTILES